MTGLDYHSISCDFYPVSIGIWQLHACMPVGGKKEMNCSIHVDMLVDVAPQVMCAAACVYQDALVLSQPHVTVAVLLIGVIHLCAHYPAVIRAAKRENVRSFMTLLSSSSAR